MAKKGGNNDEHRMLFDLRGKRRNVVKVVYAVLAVLMGLSLLLIAGPLPFGDIFGQEDAQELAREQAEEQQQRINVKLKQDPQNPDLLASLTRSHLTAGRTLSEEVAPGQIAMTPEARQQYEQAASTWEEYLEATKEAAPNLAQQMAATLFSLAETSSSGTEVIANVNAAAAAQQMVANQRPNLGSLGTAALYYLFAFDYAKAKQVNQEAKKYATSKFQREQLDNQLEENEKRAKEFEKQFKEEEQLNKQVQESQQGAEGGGTGGGEGGSFTNPFQVGSGVSE
jgi:hypothetical protein